MVNHGNHLLVGLLDLILGISGIFVIFKLKPNITMCLVLLFPLVTGISHVTQLIHIEHVPQAVLHFVYAYSLLLIIDKNRD